MRARASVRNRYGDEGEYHIKRERERREGEGTRGRTRKGHGDREGRREKERDRCPDARELCPDDIPESNPR